MQLLWGTRLKQKNRGAQKLGPGNSVIGTSERKRISRPALRPGNITLGALRHFVSAEPELGLLFIHR
jgi:hypothetical protein